MSINHLGLYGNQGQLYQGQVAVSSCQVGANVLPANLVGASDLLYIPCTNGIATGAVNQPLGVGLTGAATGCCSITFDSVNNYLQVCNPVTGVWKRVALA